MRAKNHQGVRLTGNKVEILTSVLEVLKEAQSWFCFEYQKDDKMNIKFYTWSNCDIIQVKNVRVSKYFSWINVSTLFCV